MPCMRRRWPRWMMAIDESAEYLSGLLHELRKLPRESEWVEFKHNNANPQELGEYISALANGSTLCGKATGYLVWGVSDPDQKPVGTGFRPTQARKGNEELESWLLRLLQPRIHFRFIEFEHDDKHFVILEIPCAVHRPVRFSGIEYIRVGSSKKKLKDYPEKERALWRAFDVTPFEQQVAAAKLGADSVLEHLDYPAYFRLLELPLPADRAAIMERLAQDGMIRSRTDGCWDILNIGAILFAIDLSRFTHLQRKAVRVVEYDGNGRIRTRREHCGHVASTRWYPRPSSTSCLHPCSRWSRGRPASCCSRTSRLRT